MTVLAIEQAVAAPLCTGRLAEAGARVIKVERPEGDFARAYDDVVAGEASYFVWTNRGKESIVLNLKDPDDVALVHRILARADVFVQNLSPGSADRLGLGSDHLRTLYHQLVTCDIGGYGAGPFEQMKAYDFLIQCESGMVSITGAPGHPGRFGVSIVDIGAGMNAAEGILRALIHRERTGDATGVKVSLFDTAADWMTVPIAHHDFRGKAPEPMGMVHPSVAPYGAYGSADGSQVVISIQNNREWARFADEVLGAPELATDDRFATNNARVSNRTEMNQIIEDRFLRYKMEDLRPLLLASGTAHGSINSVEQAAHHPQLRHWAMTVHGQHLQMIAPPIQTPFDEESYRDIPTIGQHTGAIREEFAP
jgi:itaconate CoA-transferase